MAMYKKTMHLIASKLGLSDDDKVLGKAAEFERLLQTKTMAGSNLSEISKVVIHLDLAAGLLGTDFDLKTAIKYSGLRPTMYNNSKKMIENLLEINTNKLTTSILCATLHCPSVQMLADKILDTYKRQAKMEIDLNLPQYVCMAVYHACRISKVKVSKAKINEKSRLKPSQWAKLDAEWTKLVDTHFAGPENKQTRSPKVVQYDEPEAMDVDLAENVEPSEPVIEPYEVWKRRMLETAYEELRLEAIKIKQLKELRVKEGRKTPEAKKEETRLHKEMSRKSPRKTPGKYSPYKDVYKLEELRIREGAKTPEAQKEESRVHNEMLMPRKSPRKTPEKYSSYNVLKTEKLKDRDVKKYEANKKELLVNKELKVRRSSRQTPDKYSSHTELHKLEEQNVRENKLEVHEEKVTLRRSPRKTPQKYAPYKSPEKGKGVRLLFPKEL